MKMRELLEDSIALWHACPACLPPMPRAFSEEEQAIREGQLDGFLEAIEAELRSIPRTRAERQAARDRVTAAFVHFAQAALDLDEQHIRLLLDGGFSAIGTNLGRQARRFDPAVSVADIFQASRNAWTACGLQVLLGGTMSLTPAIFAYSMLYPYTDNYLDEPATSSELKIAFSTRFGRRLTGEDVPPDNGRETAIWRLVAMIEEQYDRALCPQVFASLRAIHRAQENSLRLFRQGPSAGPADILRLGFEKGGASVLADGYLAAETLSADQARFIFDWGVLLQLADDLQDVGQDCRAGALTLFSQAAPRERLDELTSRTLQFGREVMRRMYDLPGPGCRALKELMERSVSSMLIRSAGEAGGPYSRAYLARLEPHSPFRFSFLNARRNQFARRSGLLIRLFEAFLEGDEDEPAFPLLPGALMPRA
jgi:hypothetical protein